MQDDDDNIAAMIIVTVFFIFVGVTLTTIWPIVGKIIGWLFLAGFAIGFASLVVWAFKHLYKVYNS